MSLGLWEGPGKRGLEPPPGGGSPSGACVRMAWGRAVARAEGMKSPLGVPFARAVTNSVLSQRCGSNEFLDANNVWRRRVQKLPGDEVSNKIFY